MNLSPDQILLNFGRNLQKLRQDKGLSLRELAAMADVEHALIHRIETGKTNTRLVTIVRLAEALSVDPAILLKNLDRPSDPIIMKGL